MSRRSSLLILAAMLCVPALWAGADSADERARGEVEAVARALHAAYAANDAAAVTSFWSEDSPERPYIAHRMTGDLRVYCIVPQSFSIDSIEVAGNEATVRTTAAVRRVPHTEGRPSEVVERRTLELTRAGDAWKAVRWRTEERRVVDELIAVVEDAAAADSILAKNAHLIGLPLVEEMVLFYDERQYVASKFDRGLARAAMRVAGALGDLTARALVAPLAFEINRTPAPAARPAARALLREAVALAELTNDVDAKAAVLGFLGVLEMDEDESSTEAERIYRWIVTHESSIRRDRTLNNALTNLGGCLLARQDYAGSYAAFQEALRRKPWATQFSLYYIGQIHERQNDPELALQYYLRSLEGATRKPFATTIFTYLGMGNVRLSQGDRAAARDHYRDAIELSRKYESRPGLLARSLVPYAELLVREGDFDGATAALSEAIEKAHASGSLAPHIDALMTLGRIELLRGRSGEALRIAGEVLAISGKLAFPGYERYAALMLSGRAHRLAGDDAAAVEAFTRAVERLEEVRGLVAGAERQQRLSFEPVSGAYVELVDLLLRQDRVVEALTYAERAKGRVLLDALQNGKGAPVLADADRRERQSRVDALGRLNRALIEARSRAVADASVTGLEADLRRAQVALDQLEDELAVRYPAPRRTAAPTIDAAGLRRLAARDDVAFLEFVVHERATYVFVIRRAAGGEPSITPHRIDVDRATLERRVTEFVRRLESRDLDWREESRALHDLLLAPAADALRGVHAIGIVPDGVLWRMPFEALSGNDGRFLVERAACFYAPSLSVLDAVASRDLKRGAAGDTLLAFGNPSISVETRQNAAVHRDLELTPLPEAETEVRGIERVYGRTNSRVFVREAAVEERAKELMSGVSVVHFATHGLLDDRNPMYSQLVLARGGNSAEDGVLQAWEMMQLDIGADLVVLSACDTARGRFGAGEGLIGMSWALFAGGCPSTVATLWKISSLSAADLMVAFHQELARRKGNSYAKAQALRAAQLRFIRDPRRSHPHDWSPFVLVGSPR